MTDLTPTQKRYSLLKKYRSATLRETRSLFCRHGYLFNLSETDSMLHHLDTLQEFATHPTQDTLHNTHHALAAAAAILRNHKIDTAKLDKLLTEIA